MQICYARKLHNMTKFHKTWKSHKTLFSETIIETNNIFAIRGKKAFQEPTSRSLPPPYKPYESIFARIFLFLERHELFGTARTV